METEKDKNLLSHHLIYPESEGSRTVRARRNFPYLVSIYVLLFFASRNEEKKKDLGEL
jgi:hypothetical protein